MDFIKYQCPSCENTLKIPTNLIGKTLTCPNCKNLINPTFEENLVEEPLEPTSVQKEVPQMLYFAKVVEQKILIKIFPVKNAMYLWGLTTKNRILSSMKMYQIILLHQL